MQHVNRLVEFHRFFILDALILEHIFLGGLPRNVSETELQDILNAAGANNQLSGVVSVCRESNARGDREERNKCGRKVT